MNLHLTNHLLYLAIAVPLTVWVARTLHRNGRVFLVDAFRGNESLADSINHLLLVGFYLLNVGFVLLFLRQGQQPETVGHLIEGLASKVGLVMLFLGGIHFLNLHVFNKWRKRTMEAREDAPPPLLPTARLAEKPGM